MNAPVPSQETHVSFMASSMAERQEFFPLAAESQLAENSRQGSERRNRTPAPGFAALKSQTTQWGSWQTSGGTASGPTVYLYDGPNLVEEVDNNGNVLARYTQGQGIDQPLAELRSGTTSYYQQDGLSSVTSLSNSSGALANTYSYDSFGNSTASTGTITNVFQYTGREFDSETGTYYYRARYFQGSAGRFLNEDPIGFAGGSSNLYAYSANNPVIYSDPSGLAYTISRSPGVITVNAAITLYGPGATAALAQNWRQVISEAWNSNPGQGTCSVHFNVEISVLSARMHDLSRLSLIG